MYQDYSPILLLIVFAIILLALPLIIQSIISPKQNKGGDKLIPFECGELPEGSAWVKFNIRFYVIALVFLIFDVEIGRFKGLGEMMPEQLKKTTMDPENRYLIKVCLPSSKLQKNKVMKSVKNLMGKNAELRAKIVQTNAKKIKELRI